MAADDFDDRVALLEEHIVAPEPTSPETFLAWAEEALAEGDHETALAWLRHAKIRQNLNDLERSNDAGEVEEEVDDV